MVRQSKINELIENKVRLLIQSELEKVGFKYLKAKNQFIKNHDQFLQVINFYNATSPLVYEEKNENLFLRFNVDAKIEIPDYDKWYLDKVGEKSFFYENIEILFCEIELSLFDYFNQEDFFEGTESRKFKNYITSLISKSYQNNQEIISSDILIKEKLPNLISKLNVNSSIIKMFESSNYPSVYGYLLFYGGYDTLAFEQLDKIYENYNSEIESRIKNSDVDLKISLEGLTNFIQTTYKITNKLYENQFKRSVNKIASKNDNLIFDTDLKFVENLRLDISQFDIKNCHLNLSMEIFLFTDYKRIIKLNSKAEVLFEKEIELKKGFDKIWWQIPSGFIKETNEFYINNYVLTNDNILIELVLPLEKLKKGKLQNPHIIGLSYWPKEEKYLMLYENYLLTYSKNYILEKTLNIENKYKNRIIIEKEWIVTSQNDEANIIKDFNGNLIGSFEYGKGNSLYEFSSSYDYLLSFFYSTKSQFHNITNGKKEILWAHPTHIKDYKEKLYNDINHNFGMTIAKFSPDNKYIVGGAYHGKYVAWKLPKLERIELIPKDEVIEQLEGHKIMTYSENGNTETTTKPQIVDLEGMKFLKNRENDIKNIVFLKGGDIFLTAIGNKMILSWNRDSKNLFYNKFDGKLDYHFEKYLTRLTQNELVIYQQE